jgi:hypothetical protein
MKSSLRSIIERANHRPAREKADAIQWHSCKEPDEEWRSIMAKYRSPSSEATTAPRRAEAVVVDSYGDWLDRFGAHARGLVRSWRTNRKRGAKSAWQERLLKAFH